MDTLDFTEEEIQEQLAILGYKNIPKHRLREFKQDLDDLIRHGDWRSFSSPTQINGTKPQTVTSQPSPPAYTKEKVSQSYFEDSVDGFFLHAGQTNHDRQVLTTCQNRDYGRQQGSCDSYAQHSVAPRLRLPSGAPNRLQVESDPDDTLHPPLTDSYTSSPDTQGRRFIKRKVLRKHQGQSLVCDESVYSEDSAPRLHRSHRTLTSAGEQVAAMYKMYNAQCDDESDDDKSSLNSSFWSDGEQREEEEEEEEKVVIERVISEEDKPVASVEDSLDQEASEEEKVEIERAIGEEDSKPVAHVKDSHHEASEEEEEEKVETEPVISEEDSKPADDVDESHQEFSEEEEEESEPVKSEEDSNPGNDEEDSEEEVKVERVIDEEDSKTVADSEESLQESSEEEEPELNSQGNVSRESSEGGCDDDDDDDDDDNEEEEEEEEDEEEEGSSSCDSPAPSLMTSGYGTYRPEEQEGGDYRDDHTVTEFDQDSRGDLSEMRDDEEDYRSLCSFSGFDIEPAEPDYSETRPPSVLAAPEPEANVACCGEEELDITDMKPDEDEDQADEEKFEDLHAASQNEVMNTTSEEQNQVEDRFFLDGKHLESREEENNVEKEDKVESEDPDESSSNKDIKFIDSKVDFSQMTYDEMCEEWEGNLRHKKDAASCLEERLAELHLSPAAQRNFETENEDVTSHSDTQSSETEGVSMSAFESYLRGMTRAHSDSDVRPKPKSFIRPVRHQPTIKKTDPVAKYFQYKQLWEMFKLPGETDRKAIRLEIKERLAYQPPPPKPRRVYVPNTYIVPTEKKRSALRWEIRNDLANGLLPYKFSYRF